MEGYFIYEGNKFRKIERRAKEGDLILVTNFDGNKVECVRRVVFDHSKTFEYDAFTLDKAISGEDYLSKLADDKYFVLQQVPDPSEEESTDMLEKSCKCGGKVEVDILETIVSMAREIRKLKEQVAELNKLSERNTEDIIELDSRTERTCYCALYR